MDTSVQTLRKQEGERIVIAGRDAANAVPEVDRDGPALDDWDADDERGQATSAVVTGPDEALGSTASVGPVGSAKTREAEAEEARAEADAAVKAAEVREAQAEKAAVKAAKEAAAAAEQAAQAAEQQAAALNEGQSEGGDANERQAAMVAKVKAADRPASTSTSPTFGLAAEPSTKLRGVARAPATPRGFTFALPGVQL